MLAWDRLSHSRLREELAAHGLRRVEIVDAEDELLLTDFLGRPNRHLRVSRTADGRNRTGSVDIGALGGEESAGLLHAVDVLLLLGLDGGGDVVGGELGRPLHLGGTLALRTAHQPVLKAKSGLHFRLALLAPVQVERVLLGRESVRPAQEGRHRPAHQEGRLGNQRLLLFPTHLALSLLFPLESSDCGRACATRLAEALSQLATAARPLLRMIDERYHANTVLYYTLALLRLKFFNTVSTGRITFILTQKLLSLHSNPPFHPKFSHLIIPLRQFPQHIPNPLTQRLPHLLLPILHIQLHPLIIRHSIPKHPPRHILIKVSIRSFGVF